MQNYENEQKKLVLKYQLSTDSFKTYDSPPSIHQLSADIIVFDKILISLKRLENIMNKEQIQTFINQFIQREIDFHNMINSDFGLEQQTVIIETGLQIIPCELSIGVIEYEHTKYKLNKNYYDHFLHHRKFNAVKDLREIMHINFSNLIELSIIKQQITNIDDISFINAPNLQFINLSENYIVQINSLTKAEFKSLKGINITKNPVKLIEKTSRLHSLQLLPYFIILKDTQIQKSFVCQKQNINEINFIENLPWFFKLQMSEDMIKRNSTILLPGMIKQKSDIQRDRQEDFQLIGYSDMGYGKQQQDF